MNIDTVIASLKIMGIGMFTIFVVIIVIMLIVMLLKKLTNKPDTTDKEQDNRTQN